MKNLSTISTKFWVRISLYNLLIVASIGVLMRYKIGFEFPYFNQKYLQEGHSHFAFLGWVTQTLMVLITHFLKSYLSSEKLKPYNLLLVLNLLISYLTLFSLVTQGYGIISIAFLTLSVIVSFVFTYFCFRDFGNIKTFHLSIRWFKASLIFNILSSFGTFALAYMVISKNLPQNAYLVSEYWYLHFQYNGWFFFACMGLFLAYITNIFPDFKLSNSIFRVFVLSCILSFGLSILWLKISVWIYIIFIFGAIAQMLGWIKLLLELRKFSFFKNKQIKNLPKLLYAVVAIAITIKLLLQLGSTIPEISKLAFGFRPIVIAYLHLVLLVIVSVFLLTHFYSNNLILVNRVSSTGLMVFVSGVYINELILGVQGVASLSYHIVPYVNYLLFGASIVLFSGLIILLFGQFVNSVKK